MKDDWPTLVAKLSRTVNRSYGARTQFEDALGDRGCRQWNALLELAAKALQDKPTHERTER